jgi:membrane associated rhomboid family serine protease
MLIPIGHEDQKVNRLPWITITLIVANVLVFLFMLPAVNRQADEVRVRVHEILRFAEEHPYLRVPKELAPFVPHLEPSPDIPRRTIVEQQAALDGMIAELRETRARTIYVRYGYVPAQPTLLALFTSMFLHGGWLHLVGNMLFLWLAGTSLEDRWGRIFFPIFYLLSGVLATLSHAAMHPQSTIPMVGASGAIAGLMGAFLVRLGKTRIKFFYWFYVVRGTFYSPAYLVLPVWLLEQIYLASLRQAIGIAVWAHIGGFAFGAVLALIIRYSNLEATVLAPSIEKKTSYKASGRLTQAMSKLDRGDTEGAIKGLEAILKTEPGNIDARTALVDAYTRVDNAPAAGRESARLVGAYLRARDLDGATAAYREHRQSYPGVPLPARDLLALAANAEKARDFHDAVDLYRAAVEAWPEDQLAPRALLGLGRLTLQVFQQPQEALELLERALTHPKATAEFQMAGRDLMVQARQALGQAAEAPAPGAVPSSAPSREVIHDVATVLMRAPEGLRKEAAAPAASPPTVAAIPVEAVGIDAKGLALQDRQGKASRLAWSKITGLSVGAVGGPVGSDEEAARLVLDLVMGPNAHADGAAVRSVRLTARDLAIPQLQAEPSPLRAFQRLVATILKLTNTTPYPSRDACLGVGGFATFPDLAAYEADLAFRIATRSP